MVVDWTAARFLWDLFQGVVLAIISVYVWFRTRNRVTASAIEDLRDDIRKVEREVGKRTQFRHLDEVQKELELTNRRLAEVSAKLEATTSLLNRMHEFMLQAKHE